MKPAETYPATLNHAPVLVVGAGVMGAGIAQIAAQAGHAVSLYDNRAGAAATAKATLEARLEKGLVKGKYEAAFVQTVLARIAPIDSLVEGQGAVLVVEAIAEELEAKRVLLRKLEALLGATCIFASNTSALSITALAKGLERPERVVGMHFFNPAPVMQLVEIVQGLQTASTVAALVFELARCWQKKPVRVRSAPGFIVNRIARPFYAETLGLLKERGNQPAPTPAALDACLRGAGFRMGPCELMDLIGLDVNYAVTQAVYEASFYDKRYVPSAVQRELLEAGLLGRKSGHGFYRYDAAGKAVPAQAKDLPTQAGAAILPGAKAVVLYGDNAFVRLLADACTHAQVHFSWRRNSVWQGLACDRLHLRCSQGETATALQAKTSVSETIVVVDWVARSNGIRKPTSDKTPVLGYALPRQLTTVRAAQATQQVQLWLAAAGLAPLALADTPGLVVARTLAMLINEAADAVQQGVCSVEDADIAMRWGVNYPAGPFEWLMEFGTEAVVQVLSALDNYYRGERYRLSPWLQQRLAVEAA